MLLKLLVSPAIWRYFANWSSHVSGRALDWVTDVFYLAAEVEPGGEEA